jgi:hypothetical protein
MVGTGGAGGLFGFDSVAGRVDSTGGRIATSGSTGGLAFFLAGIFLSSSRI